MDFVDLKMIQLDDGSFDLSLSDGGLELDHTLETSIASSLFTDSFSSNISFGSRRGCYGIFFGNNAWTKLKHLRNNDEDSLSFINNEYNQALQRDFTNNGVWIFTEININFILGNLFVELNGYNSTNNENKFSYSYKLSGNKVQ